MEQLRNIHLFNCNGNTEKKKRNHETNLFFLVDYRLVAKKLLEKNLGIFK